MGKGGRGEGILLLEKSKTQENKLGKRQVLFGWRSSEDLLFVSLCLQKSVDRHFCFSKQKYIVTNRFVYRARHLLLVPNSLIKMKG